MDMVQQQQAPGDRRRHLRFSLALPVNIHLAGRADPVEVEIIDIGQKGVRFRRARGRVGLDEQAAFGFVIPGHHVCVASGTVMRIVGDDEFVLAIERANDAFHGFLGSLAPTAV